MIENSKCMEHKNSILENWNFLIKDKNFKLEDFDFKMEVNLWQHEPAASLPSGLRKEDILTRITPELCPSSPSHSIHRTYRVNSIFYFIRSELIHSFSCLSVSLYQINEKNWTDQTQLFVGPHKTPGKISGCLKLQKVVIRFS